jgi:TRAP-type C4-dicarboxylate transport system substrate-binding protein
MKTLTTATLATLICGLSLGQAVAAPSETMRCAHQFPPSHSLAVVIDKWAAEIEKLSDGDIDVQVFPANSLVSDRENIPAVAKGDIECAFALNFAWGRTLPTGVIDAALSDIAAAVSRKYYEVQDHMSVVPVISVYAHGFVNPTWYDGLSASNQEALDKAGHMAAIWVVDESGVAIADAPAQLQAQGVKLHWTTPQEQQAMADVMLPAFNEAFGKWAGKDSEELVKLVQELQ